MIQRPINTIAAAAAGDVAQSTRYFLARRGKLPRRSRRSFNALAPRMYTSALAVVTTSVTPALLLSESLSICRNVQLLRPPCGIRPRVASVG